MCAICAIKYGGQACHYNFNLSNDKTFGLFTVEKEELLDEYLPTWVDCNERFDLRASLDH